jgi:hypothetical protein
MKIKKVTHYTIEDIHEYGVTALASILSNLTTDSINKYLESRGGMSNILSDDVVTYLVELGVMLNKTRIQR